ncbi:hypothetical protein FOA52_000477 [Chlamydomonas sp. UWO 241]|nr:hypothetical protein FOA52_000477 [Chlamydomonas sp. UWO 241]
MPRQQQQQQQQSPQSQQLGSVHMPGTECVAPWLSHDTVCALLSDPPTTLVFVGDSVTRHFMHGMQLVVRGDYRAGAMRNDAGVPPNETHVCTCNRQFARKECRPYILKDTRHVEPNQACPNARVVYFGATKKDEINVTEVSDFVNSQERALLLIGGWGLHDSLRAKPVYYDLVARLHERVKHSRSVKTLCVGVHATQDNMPAEFLPFQNNGKVKDYNGVLQRLCLQRHVRFFDTFELTHSAPAIDGVHYGIEGVRKHSAPAIDGEHNGIEINVLKAHLLLSYVMHSAAQPWDEATWRRPPLPEGQ